SNATMSASWTSKSTPRNTSTGGATWRLRIRVNGPDRENDFRSPSTSIIASLTAARDPFRIAHDRVADGRQVFERAVVRDDAHGDRVGNAGCEAQCTRRQTADG